MSSFRLCFFARSDSVHTRRWVDPFLKRGDRVWVLNAAALPAQRPWDGVQLIDLPARFNLRWLRYPVWTLYAKAIVHRLQPDLLHAHYVELAGWLAAAVGYHPLVVTVWGSDVLVHPDQSRVVRALARWVLGQAEAVTAPARPLYDRAVALAGNPNKVHLIHWGVDCQVFDPGVKTSALRATLRLKPEAPVLLCPRALAPIYNIETVLRAVKKVVQHEPAATLLLVEFNPQPDYRLRIDQWIRELELQEHVRFLPLTRDPVQLAARYQLADVVVSLPFSDSLSLTILESMACGVPVVISELPAYEGWIQNGETGYAVPVCDVEAAAEAVLTLVKSKEKRLEIGQRCRTVACQQFSLEQQVQRAIELYKGVISTQRPPGAPEKTGLKR